MYHWSGRYQQAEVTGEREQDLLKSGTTKELRYKGAEAVKRNSEKRNRSQKKKKRTDILLLMLMMAAPVVGQEFLMFREVEAA